MIIEASGENVVVLGEYNVTIPASLSPLPLYLLSPSQLLSLVSPASGLGKRKHDSQQTNHEHAHSSQRFHLLGRVLAISPILSSAAGIYYFVHLFDCGHRAPTTSDEGEAAQGVEAFVLFSGQEQLIWYDAIRVDEIYLFANLRVTRLMKGDEERRLFVANNKKNKQRALPQQQIDGVERSPYEDAEQSRNPLVYNSRFFTVPPYSALPALAPLSPENNKQRQETSMSQTQSPSQSQSQTQSQLPSDLCLPLSPSRSPSSFSPLSLVSYSCVLGRQLTPGVFELESDEAPTPPTNDAAYYLALPRPRLRLYLSHRIHPDLFTGCGLRPGARIRLVNAHTIFSRRRFMGFGLCARGGVEIEAMSDRAACCVPLAGAGHELLAEMMGKLTLTQAAILVDCIVAIKNKLGPEYTTKRIIKRTAATNTPQSNNNTASPSNPPSSPDASSNPYCGILFRLLPSYFSFTYSSDVFDDFFHHNNKCTAGRPLAHNGAASSGDSDGAANAAGAGAAASSVADPFFPWLSGLLHLPAVAAAARELLDEAAQAAMGEEEIQEGSRRLTARELLSPNMFIIGHLRAVGPSCVRVGQRIGGAPDEFARAPCGFELADQRGAVDCFVTGSPHTNALALPGLYALPAFDLVLEYLLVRDAANKTRPRVAAYLIVDPAALVRLEDATPASDKCALSATGGRILSLSSLSAVSFFFRLHWRAVRRVCCSSGPPSAQAAAWANKEDMHEEFEYLLQGDYFTASAGAAAIRPCILQLRPPLSSLLGWLAPGLLCAVDGAVAMAPLALEADAPMDAFFLDAVSSLRPASLAWATPLPPSFPSPVSLHSLLSLSAIPRPGSSASGERIDLCSFTALLLHKALRASDIRRGAAASSSACVGRWCLRLRDPHSQDVAQLYVDLQQAGPLFPAGLLAGQCVAIHGALRKLSSKYSIYFEANERTIFTIVDTPPNALAPNDNADPADSMRTRYLHEFSPHLSSLSQHLARLRVRVSSVRSLSLQYRCSWGCPASLISSCFHRGCHVALHAHAGVSVDDGTATANLYCEDERTVMELMGLSDKERDSLRAQLMQVGSLTHDWTASQPESATAAADDDAVALARRHFDRRVASLRGTALIVHAVQFFPKGQVQQRRSASGAGGHVAEFLEFLAPRSITIGPTSARFSVRTLAPTAPRCFKAVRVSAVEPVEESYALLKMLKLRDEQLREQQQSEQKRQ